MAEKFARYDAAVVVGRYTHMAFWQEPDLINAQNPVLGMAQNYLICPNNHAAPILIDLILGLCRKYEVDGMVIHASRTCRAFTNPQFLIADAATKKLGIQTTMFEGDVTDESFYKDELLNSRVEAMLEASTPAAWLQPDPAASDGATKETVMKSYVMGSISARRPRRPSSLISRVANRLQRRA